MTAIWAIDAALLGCVIGSFLTVLTARVPQGGSIVRPPSFCPNCFRPLPRQENIPVLSWIILRGRCRGCAKKISVRYPLIEGATGLLFAGLSTMVRPWTALGASFVFAACAVGILACVLERRRVPLAVLKYLAIPFAVACVLVAR